MRISDWSSDVCSSDLRQLVLQFSDVCADLLSHCAGTEFISDRLLKHRLPPGQICGAVGSRAYGGRWLPSSHGHGDRLHCAHPSALLRSEEHTSELQSLMRISYAVFCLKKKNTNNTS